MDCIKDQISKTFLQPYRDILAITRAGKFACLYTAIERSQYSSQHGFNLYILLASYPDLTQLLL